MIEQLKQWLLERRRDFTDYRYISVGCSTCGDYDEIEELDMDKLMSEIDEFAASFKKD